MDKKTLLEDTIEILPLSTYYEEQSKALILEGFKERFGFIDQSLNPDLHNLYSHYSQPGRLFLIGLKENEVVVTGALIQESIDTGRIVRMSVDHLHRRHGLAERMLKELEALAINLGYRKLVLETNLDWESATNFYKKMSFKEEKKEDGLVHFSKYL